MNLENYCSRILTLVEDWLGEHPEFSFQQDNALIYGSKYTTNWMEEHDI